MNKLTTNLKTGLSRRMRFFRMIRGFFGTLLLTGLTGVLLFAVFINGCQKESPGIVNVCVTPIVIRTSPANGVTNVSINGATAVKVSISSTAVKKSTTSFKKKSAAPSASVRTCQNNNGNFQYADDPEFSHDEYIYRTAGFYISFRNCDVLRHDCDLYRAKRSWTQSHLYMHNYNRSQGFGRHCTRKQLFLDIYDDCSRDANARCACRWSVEPSYESDADLECRTGSRYLSFAGLDEQHFAPLRSITTRHARTLRNRYRLDSWDYLLLACEFENFRRNECLLQRMEFHDHCNACGAGLSLAPLMQRQNQPTSPTLSWNASAGAATYRLQVSTSNTFAATVFDDSTITGTSQPIIGLDDGTDVLLACGCKEYCRNECLLNKELYNHPYSTSAAAVGRTCRWRYRDHNESDLELDSSIGAGTYRLQVDTNNSFTNPLFNDSTISGLSQPVSGLVNGKTYYWRVNAKNSSSTSGYSTTWSFIIATVPPLVLGSTSTFGIMATSAITSTGNSVINGDVSLNPGSSMSGFPPGLVNGAIHINDGVSTQARTDLLTAYNYFKNLAPGTTISAGADLGALYPSGIAPGTYTSGSTMLVSTPLVLDAGGNANAVWVFQIGSSLTTGANVSLLTVLRAKNVYWVPTLDATIGVGTIFYGTIVSGRDVTAVTGATINGRILAGATTAGTIALQDATVNVPAP